MWCLNSHSDLDISKKWLHLKHSKRVYRFNNDTSDRGILYSHVQEGHLHVQMSNNLSYFSTYLSYYSFYFGVFYNFGNNLKHLGCDVNYSVICLLICLGLLFVWKKNIILNWNIITAYVYYYRKACNYISQSRNFKRSLSLHDYWTK